VDEHVLRSRTQCTLAPSVKENPNQRVANVYSAGGTTYNAPKYCASVVGDALSNCHSARTPSTQSTLLLYSPTLPVPSQLSDGYPFLTRCSFYPTRQHTWDSPRAHVSVRCKRPTPGGVNSSCREACTWCMSVLTAVSSRCLWVPGPIMLFLCSCSQHAAAV
jgi:hypothetical protein